MTEPSDVTGVVAVEGEGEKDSGAVRENDSTSSSVLLLSGAAVGLSPSNSERLDHELGASVIELDLTVGKVFR